MPSMPQTLIGSMSVIEAYKRTSNQKEDQKDTRSHKSQLSKLITKERASRLEGSFGTDKAYFLLNKIKARTKETEKLWIFMGIHTSNTLIICSRMTKSIAQIA